MAKRNLVTNEIKTDGGAAGKFKETAKKQPTSGGMGYTRTATDLKTGKKTTTTGTLTPITKAQFNANGKRKRGGSSGKTTRKIKY